MAGFTPDQLRRPMFDHPTDGVAVHRDDSSDLIMVCEAVMMMLSGNAVFTHITSAQLREWWLPYIPDSPIIAGTNGEAPHHDRRGVYVRRCDIPLGHRSEIRKLPVASAEWTIIELAEHLSLIDLVIVIDCALHRSEVTVASIRATMRKGRRGVRILRRALDRCDRRSESPWETALRLLFELSGIQVEPQVVLRDKDGQFVARADLLIRGTNRLAEYDGAVHRDRAQHRTDLSREKACVRLGFERFGYTAIEIDRNPGLIIADAEAALGLRHDPRRLKAWQHEYAASALSTNGRRALIQRLARFARMTTPRPADSASGADL